MTGQQMTPPRSQPAPLTGVYWPMVCMKLGSHCATASSSSSHSFCRCWSSSDCTALTS